MNEQKIIEAMARADDIWPNHELGGYVKGTPEPDGNIPMFETLPAYTTSHDACQRVIDELKSELNYGGVFELYQKSLKKIICPNGLGFGWLGMVLRATPLQKCEAILNALGKWEEG